MKNVIAALTEGFAEIEPDVTISYDPTGSGAGITGATDKTLDIGLSSRALKDDETGDTVKAVTVGGVECSEETVKDGSYEVQRPFVFVTNDSVTLSAQAQAFFDFATSTDAADLIRTAGAVPVNE